MPKVVLRSDTVAFDCVALRAIEPAARKPVTPSAAASISTTTLPLLATLLTALLPSARWLSPCRSPLTRSQLDQPYRVEEGELGRGHAPDRGRDKLTAEKTENVPVTRVPCGHPAALLARHPADDREQIRDEPEDARPAVGDLDRPAGELGDEGLEGRLDGRRRLLPVGELGRHVDVAEAAGEDRTVGALVPVVEAAPAVVRPLEPERLD